MVIRRTLIKLSYYLITLCNETFVSLIIKQYVLFLILMCIPIYDHVCVNPIGALSLVLLGDHPYLLRGHLDIPIPALGLGLGQVSS